MSLLDKINDLKNIKTLSKHEQLVHGVIEAIDSGILVSGDQLPSINRMVADLGYARKTIVKAYEELKDRGLVESKKLKGYFIISQETKVTLKVALLLFAFQKFQEEFYNTFRKELGKRFQIDVFFHHNNVAVFETIFNNITGKYGMYVVAPIPDPSIRPLLMGIEPSKLLIIDRFYSLPESYSYISQVFEDSMYSRLVELLPKLTNYEKLVLIASDESYYPTGTVKAFENFLNDFDIDGSVQNTYERGSLKRGYVYFFIGDSFLWEVLKDCGNHGYKVGKDIGILSCDDHIVKEIVSGGITTISADFEEMAIKAANYIKNPEPTHEIVPINLIERGSL
ncbi:GntR family transcriptional regulator [Flavobacteriaceae bacterium TP-CH-4]|uniref:GntR family transcriptional regulator n=1 Tax=Pelagihabitans pacificus TaxID=2696054 RepID=A0A967EBS5_9FLAO|nr:GntR family transcriptional regulator [Pelagihabitans pacificus]NHF60586.1 GntR family transcriptional regulator [Pelagihabitans pacificus]